MAYFDIYSKGKSVRCDDDAVQMLVTVKGELEVTFRSGEAITFLPGDWDHVQIGNPWMDRDSHEFTVGVREGDLRVKRDFSTVRLSCACGWEVEWITTTLAQLRAAGEVHIKQVRGQ